MHLGRGINGNSGPKRNHLESRSVISFRPPSAARGVYSRLEEERSNSRMSIGMRGNRSKAAPKNYLCDFLSMCSCQKLLRISMSISKKIAHIKFPIATVSI